MSKGNAQSGHVSAWIAYVLTPQVLPGGVLGWGATHAWDYGKELRDRSDKELSEVRDAIQKYVIPTPTTLQATLAAMAALETVATLHEDTKSQDLLNRQLADLGRLRDTQKAAEESRRREAEAQAKAKLEADKAAEARKEAEEASARERAAAEAVAVRQQEIAKTAAAVAQAAQKQKAIEAARADRALKWFDRAPK